MIGNDIVDLQLARQQSNWQRRGWLQKLFTNNEQKQILVSETPETLVWQLWSMKEATYKAHQRRFQLAPKFNPNSFQCITDHSVVIDGFEYYTTTEISSQRIYTTAIGINTSYISEVYSNPKQAKLKLQKLVAAKYAEDLINVSIKKDENHIPFIQLGHTTLEDLQFSMTHHGLHSAFIIDL